MISIKSCNPFSRSECLAITEESCSFDSNIVFEFYCLLWLFAKLIKFLDYVLFLQVQTHFLEQYLAFSISGSRVVSCSRSRLPSRASRLMNTRDIWENRCSYPLNSKRRGNSSTSRSPLFSITHPNSC